MARRGIITFVFDDGYERVWQNAVPLLRKYKMPAVFGIALEGNTIEMSEQRPVKPWQDWVLLKQEGFEIASHSVTHRNLTKLTPDELHFELSKSAEALNATTIIYPGGAVNEAVAEAAAQWYRAGRGARHGFESVIPQNPMMLKTYNFSRNNFSVWKANLLALWAYLTGSWLIETYHMIDDSDTEMVHTVKTKDLAKHLAFVSRLPVKVKTIQGVLKKRASSSSLEQ